MTNPTGDAGTDVAARIAALLRDVPDFPQSGVLFKDISGLLADGPAFGAAIRALVPAAAGADVVAGVEARGFLVAAALAQELGAGLVPVRKSGKLPPPTLRRRYDLEYGTAEIEVPVGALDGRRVFLVDDVLATGGTMLAATDLIRAAGGEVIGLGLLLELSFLHGRDRLTTAPLTALLTV